MKIITVCGMGLGTSLILKMTVEKVLKERGLIYSVEACDIGVASSTEADIIFTNQEFAKQIHHPKAQVWSVTNIASVKEVSQLLDQLLPKSNG